MVNLPAHGSPTSPSVPGEDARTDELTGLPNRRALEEYLPPALAQAAQRQQVMALGILDLDDFKPVNDALGYENGNVLLAELTRRLKSNLGEENFLARLDGDEFAVVFNALVANDAPNQLRKRLERLHGAVTSPFVLPGSDKPATIGMTMGLALYPEDGEKPRELLRKAGAALYQAKAHKHDRTEWWHWGPIPSNTPSIEPPFNPFGEHAFRSLEAVQNHLDRIGHDFFGFFYAELQKQATPSKILQCLTPDEWEKLIEKQTNHLKNLISPQMTVESITAQATRLGQVHALVGVSGSWLTRAMSTYWAIFRHHLDTMSLMDRERHKIMRTVAARLLLDVEVQLDQIQKVMDQYNAHLSVPLLTHGRKKQSELDDLASLPGILVCQVLRPNTQGSFSIERSSGALSSELMRILNTPGTQPLLDARVPAGQGLIACAWHTGQVQTSNAYGQDPRTQVWQQLLCPLGVRSAVALPIRGAQDIESVLVLMGGYPHQFAADWIQTFVTSLQNRWHQISVTYHTVNRSPDTPNSSFYRKLLHSNGLKMFVQPVIDLHTGHLIKIEALARLVDPEGKVIPPDEFIPALRASDLTTLFLRGLEQCLELIQANRENGQEVHIALNLPPSTLLHPECALWIDENLRKHAVLPQQLTLELLEDQEFDIHEVDRAMKRLTRLGVQLAIDDLGSGYSSLQRFSDFPFDIIKIDRSILKSISSDPIKTLKLIRTMIQIGQDFERTVIVEGLENADIIEVVTLLGGRFGQGYALARPMPIKALKSWTCPIEFNLATQSTLRSYLGALAYYWRYLRFDPSTPQFPIQPPETCPLRSFLFRHPLENRMGIEHLDALTTPNAPDKRQEASDRLCQWLLERL